MSSPPATSQHPPKAAGLAGPMRMILLALTGVGFLVAGVGLGLLLQNWQKSSAGSAGHHGHGTDATVDSHESHSHPAEDLPQEEAPDHSATDHALHADEQIAEIAHPEVNISPSPSINHAEPEPFPDHAVGIPAERLIQADKLLMVGNYRNAHDEYASLASMASPIQQAELRLRLALCEEALGDHKQSQADYRKVVELRPALELREAAILGQARLWCLAGRSELATATLFRSILSGSQSRAGATNSQIPHELAVLLSQRVHVPGQEVGKANNYYVDDVLLSPTLKVEPFQVIADLATKKLTAPQEQVIPVNDVSIVDRFSQAPEEIIVNVRTERTTVLEIVRRVANRAGWTVRITEEARLLLQEHTVQPDCDHLPLALVLDALLEPFEMVWRTDQGALLILLSKHAAIEEINTYRVRSALSTLRFACTSAPDHPWTAASSLELARLSAQSGTLDVASRYLMKMLDEFPRSEFQPIGWFNLGKIELRQGRLDDALNAFHRATDMLVGHPLEALSYLYAGRIQIENDRPREAISPLTRALVLAEGSSFEPMATLQLSSAYLILEHYQRANEILMEHRAAFVGSPEQDQAAFLSNLIQYRASKDHHEQFRAGTSLLGCMTNLNPSHCFGGQWYWLAGTVYREFGMSQQEISVLRAGLKSPYAYPLQNRVRLLLLEDAPDQLADLQPKAGSSREHVRPSSLYIQTQLKEATTVFNQGNSEVALQMSRDLASHPMISEEDRRAALRLMGRIYQSRGEHELAVQCFSGIIPNKHATGIPPTAALPFPTKGVQ